MIGRIDYLRRSPTVFRAMTGLRVEEFEQLVDDMLPTMRAAKCQQQQRPDRRRAPGGGCHPRLCLTNQLLLTVVWLRIYPTNEVLGHLFWVSDSTVSRIVAWVVPLLEQNGKDGMRMPDPGRKRRKHLDALLADIPELCVLIDSFEQRVQRSKDRKQADTYYSGKKKQHTMKAQVTVNPDTGEVCDVSDSVEGPTADITLLDESGVLTRVPNNCGAMGDLAYVGIATRLPDGQGHTPRRKPRGKDRPPEDIAYNQAFAKRRVTVEHTIGRMRRYQRLSQLDRHHRKNHSTRTRAVAGLVNRQIRSRFPCEAHVGERGPSVL